MSGATFASVVPVPGPILFAYDGSELAQAAIGVAAARLAPGAEAVAVCVWQPADVGFSPVGGLHFDAANASAVGAAAQATAEHGASLASAAGFRSRGLAVRAAPTWIGIVRAAEQVGAAMIVVGSHRHPGLIGHLVGNVAAAVISHSSVPVLVVPGRA